MKNHIMVDGRLLQTNKRFSDLKEKQKAKISEWLYELYRAFFLEKGRLPRKREEENIIWLYSAVLKMQRYGYRAAR